MAFPLTHLVVAYQVAPYFNITNEKDLAQFLLGATAPDAVHFRKSLNVDQKENLGPTKKTSHLCPISEEKWGQVTDNKGWVAQVVDFVNSHPGNIFVKGIGVHVLTDIVNNKGLWHYFRTHYPEEAAKGYTSKYYDDLRTIDFAIYHNLYKGTAIERLYKAATPVAIPGLVDKTELGDIQHNLAYEQYANAPKEVDVNTCTLVTYPQMMDFIKEASAFCIDTLK